MEVREWEVELAVELVEEPEVGLEEDPKSKLR